MFEKQTKVNQSFEAADGLRLRGTAAGVATGLVVVVATDDVSLRVAVVVPAAVARVLLAFVVAMELALTAVMTAGS